MARVRVQLLLLLLLSSSSACTAAQRRSMNARHATSSDSGSAEANVPRVVCYDGNLAIGCSLEQANMAHCCANQGGVYHDAWGNVVAR